MNGNVHSDQFLSCEDKKSNKAVVSCVISAIYQLFKCCFFPI